MGSGITQPAAEADFDVSLCDLEERLFAKGRSQIEGFINRKPEKGKASRQEADAVLKRLQPTVRPDDARKAAWEAAGEEQYKPSPIRDRMRGENRLERKTKEGFHKY